MRKRGTFEGIVSAATIGLICCVVVFGMRAATLALAPEPLPDTGQTRCFDNQNEIPCPAPGEAFYGQDAQYSLNEQSYTKLDENGVKLPDSTGSWSMVRDNVTGLIWEAKTTDGSIHDASRTYSWANANGEFIAALNDARFGGFSDWRVPGIEELTSILNLNQCGPGVNTVFFPNTIPYLYWSSTPHPHDATYAWASDFAGGNTAPIARVFEFSVRAVRGARRWLSENYRINNDDGTVTDLNTGLMWQLGNSGREMDWAEALNYCEGLTLAGYDDWRLPNISELQSLVKYENWYPATNWDVFPLREGWVYWSSTTYPCSPSRAFFVDFNYGYAFNHQKTDSSYVRAVRGGEASAPIAICQDIRRPAGNSCQANAAAQDFDNGSYDPDGDPLTFAISPVGPYPLGDTLVTLTVTDTHGAKASCAAKITVYDDTPPRITSLAAKPNSLWPANHKMVPVSIIISAIDNCSPTVTSKIVNVTSNEPVDGLGDEDTAPDWLITGPLTLNLRAERSGNGAGRIYTITIECRDAAGNKATGIMIVKVPKSQGK